MIELDFKKCGGLIPAIAQDWKTNKVLMLAYINEESWNETLKSGNLLVPLPEQAVEKRRRIRQHAAGQGNPGGLRSGYGDLQSGPDRRGRLP